MLLYVLDELVNRMENVLSDNNFQKRLVKIENEIQAIEQKRNRLIDMRLEEVIDKSTYEKKYGEIESVLEGLLGEKEQLEKSSNEEIDLEKRIEHLRMVLEENEVLTEFDRCVFESIVEKVIIGEVDENGNTNPYKLTFIYKTEYSNSIQSKMNKQINRKRTQNDVKDLPSHPSTDTCGVRGRNTENLIIELDDKIANYQRKRYVVMKFFHDEKHIVFQDIGKGSRMKEVYDGVEVVVAMCT